MRALKINVEALAVEAVEVNGLDDIYKNLGDEVSIFCCPVTFENGDSLYADDEGWFKETKGGFMFPDWEYPIVNNAVILGVDKEGGSVNARTTVEELERKIVWLTASAMQEFNPLNQ